MANKYPWQDFFSQYGGGLFNGASGGAAGGSGNNPTATSGKRAMQKLIRGEDGRMKSVYVDVSTGQVINNLTGYNIISAEGDYWSAEPATPEEAEEAANSGQLGNGAWFDWDSPDWSKDGHDPQKPSGWQASDTKQAQKAYSRASADNHGYINKPGIAKYANLVPGPIGTAARVGNLAVNASNLGAVNEGRAEIGLDPLKGKEALRTVLKDQHGQVANVKINDNDYAVGYEALSPDGRTNLTPDEARKRAALLGGLEEGAPVGETNKRKSTPSDSFMSKATGLQDGWLGDAIERVFDPSSPAVKQVDAGYTPTKLTDLQPGTEKSGFLPETAPIPTSRHQTQPGLGLANLAGPAGIRSGDVAFSRERENNLSPRMSDALEGASANLGTGLNISSGYRDAVKNASVKGAKNSYHMSGNAADISMAGMDDAQRQQLVTELAQRGARGFITYDSLPDTLHADMRPGDYDKLGNNVPHFMHNKTQYQMGKAPGWMQESAMYDGYVTPQQAPIPTPNPMMTPQPPQQTGPAVTGPNNPNNVNLADKISPKAFQTSGTSNLSPIGSSLDPLAATSLGQTSPNDSYAKNLTAANLSSSRFDNVDMGSVSPAQYASLGFVQRTPEQIDRMAYALSGELDGAQLKALQAGDPEAKRELANMVTTIENRAASKMFGSFDNVLDPSQYNSLMSGKLGVTSNNYNLYGGTLNSLIPEYYSGGLVPSNYGYSSYYNPAISDPSWGPKMSIAGVTGDHRFGSLPEYGPNQGFIDARDQVGQAQVSDTRGYTPSRDYAGSNSYSYSPNLNSPGEGLMRGSSLTSQPGTVGSVDSHTSNSKGSTPQNSTSSGYTPDSKGGSSSSSSSHTTNNSQSGSKNTVDSSGGTGKATGGSSSSSGNTNSKGGGSSSSNSSSSSSHTTNSSSKSGGNTNSSSGGLSGTAGGSAAADNNKNSYGGPR